MFCANTHTPLVTLCAGRVNSLITRALPSVAGASRKSQKKNKQSAQDLRCDAFNSCLFDDSYSFV
jgi:hypothetical protein